MDDLDKLCKEIHDRYEKAASMVGWSTSSECQVEWDKLPDKNKETMRAALSGTADHISKLETLNSQLSTEASSLQEMSEKLAGEAVKLESSLPAVKGLVYEECVICEGVGIEKHIRHLSESVGGELPKCPTCKGEGRVPKKCGECEGEGRVMQIPHTTEHPTGWYKCTECKGHGYATVEEAAVIGMEVCWKPDHGYTRTIAVCGISRHWLLLGDNPDKPHGQYGYITDCYLTELSAKLLGKEL